MKTFFAIVITALFSSVVANATENPILIENGRYTVIANVPTQFGETVYENGKAIRTLDGTYLFLRSKNSNETVILFRSDKGFIWQMLGIACADVKDLEVNILENGWKLEVKKRESRDCYHLFAKSRTASGTGYVEVKR